MLQTPVLPTELNIYGVSACADQARRWLAEVDSRPLDQALVLQADQVEEVDASGVQLLLALSISLEERGRPLQLQQPSAPLQRALRLLGAHSLLAPASALPPSTAQDSCPAFKPGQEMAQ